MSFFRGQDIYLALVFTPVSQFLYDVNKYIAEKWYFAGYKDL